MSKSTWLRSQLTMPTTISSVGWAMGDDSISYTGASDDDDYACRVALYMQIPNTKIRIWDAVILIPNLMFLVFLTVGFNKARLKLRATNSPIFLTFYCLVFVNVTISITRCVVSMLVNSSSSSSLVRSYADIILWVIVRFFSMITELSVIIFGLAFGHLDSRTSIRHVLLITSVFSLAFCICQATFELLLHDQIFRVSAARSSTDSDLLLFGHGGILFWFICSIVLSTLYCVVIALPWTSLRERLALPGKSAAIGSGYSVATINATSTLNNRRSKRSFYIYASVLSFLNMSCAVGGGLLLSRINEGLCIVNLTTGLYFTFFTPLVYRVFLSDFFDVSQPNLQFSYKGQTDDAADDDNLSLPHHRSFSSLKTDSDYVYRTSDIYESTRFTATNPINPLYVASLQSPDSITGYSLDSQIFDMPSTSKP